MEKKSWKIDVAVLLIFFNRPKTLEQTFAQIQLARPRKLYLYQDGAREGNEKDAAGVAACREVVSNIDWNCEVHTLYQEKNFGCDPSGYIAQTWAFSYEEKCIVLEDDVVVEECFFEFCKELLDKYEKDERIHMICGMNNVETVDSPYSYLFTKTGSIWGWASWRRVVNTWDASYSVLDNPYELNKMRESLRLPEKDFANRLRVWKHNRESGKEYHETINGLSQYTNHRLNIVPTKNMIRNIGNCAEGGTHSMADLSMIPRGLRKIFTMPTYELSFPLSHPPYVIDDVAYEKKLYRIMGYGHPLVNLWRAIEKSYLIAKYEGLGALLKKIKRKIAK